MAYNFGFFGEKGAFGGVGINAEMQLPLMGSGLSPGVQHEPHAETCEGEQHTPLAILIWDGMAQAETQVPPIRS